MTPRFDDAQLPGATAVDSERALLVALEELLEREQACLAAQDAIALATVAEERERVVARLADAARARRAVGGTSDDPDLVERYRRLRHRHDVRARVLRRHAERNTAALGVLAQASGQPGLYGADGSVKMTFATY